jgi:hypothetical protein
MNPPDISEIISKRISASRLADVVLQSVHIELVSNAVETGYLSLSNKDRTIGEASLLADITREVERRRSRDCGLVSSIFRRSKCEQWIGHNTQVREFERILQMKASRNISDDDE